MVAPIVASVRLVTSARPETVWRALETPERRPEVQPDIAEARIEPGGKLQPGATIRTRVVPGKGVIDMSYRIVAAEPPRHVAWTSTAARMRAETEIALIDEDGRTKVAVTSRVEAETFVGRLFMAAFRGRYTAALASSITMRIRPLLALAEKM